MIYLKSLLAGFAAVLIFLFLLVGVVFVVFVVLAFSAQRSPEAGAVGWDPISLVHMKLWWLTLAAAAFAGGSLWEFRRLTRSSI